MTQIDPVQKKRLASEWFTGLSNQICERFEKLERELQAPEGFTVEPSSFFRQKTTRNAIDGSDAGGGIMSKMVSGKVFEKVGVNVSTVYGNLSPKMVDVLRKRKKIEDGESGFWASGISLVAHLNHPRVPAVHFNTRMFMTEQETWFGGGTDLNPCIEYPEDTTLFHTSLKETCDRHDPGYYEEFRDWADRYFYIPHRKRARGVGGIFFDDLDTGNWANDFEFVMDVGKTFLRVYPEIVTLRQKETWTKDDREKQLLHRGLYTEFNLIYDRGTKFGLESGHDPDAVLMSLPPLAKWK
ncbi:MAG: oxygen-dependent coproporphyrinogen oxidase [Rhodobacteraceae bacterium]|nr:oxygen-dependent coproporphyrinogen oxidase [Paracoccaceae bacterium]